MAEPERRGEPAIVLVAPNAPNTPNATTPTDPIFRASLTVLLLGVHQLERRPQTSDMLLNIGRGLCVFFVDGDNSSSAGRALNIARLAVKRLLLMLMLKLSGVSWTSSWWPVQVFAALEQRFLDELLHVR